ncbi:MAG: GAF domain-containing protein, partial [Elusimicrobia bacterium]|nr:GAF domain-containing protein [Elusimicrobiota bacterium]
FRAASGDKAGALKTMTLPIGQGIAGWVAERRQPELVNDAKNDPRFTGKFDRASGFVTRSLLCVPMIFRDELVGVVEVLNRRGGPYGPEHVQLLTTLAGLASVAVTNTKIIQEQKNFFSHVMELLTSVIETSRPHMEEHPTRSAKLACAVGRLLEVDEYEYRMLYYAGILHDIGYTAFKNLRVLAELGVGSPTDEMHPVISAKLLEGIKMLEGAIPIIRHHHERFDGGGYPSKLKGDAIPLGARILAGVEAVEELRMAGLKDEELWRRALAELRAGSGSRFDPNVVEALAAIAEHPEGTW